MPRQNSTDWSPNNPITAARLQDINEDIDDLYATGSDHLKLHRLAWDPALQVRIGPGTFRVWTVEGQYAGGTVTVSPSVTTYIMINSAGAIITSTSGWNGQNAKLAVVVSGASTITSITDWRSQVVWWELWAAGFQNITSTTYSNGVLSSFIADGVTFTITYYRWRRVASVSNGVNTWTINYSGWRISTTSKT